MKANQDIRTAITEAGVKYWQVGEMVGVSPNTFTVWLRKELPREKKELIFQAIEKAKKEFL
ncbi:hypothetical protein CG477_016770 [Bacillus cytotoxicus]|uniref:hypothetical protein n=1 Tax=Bacillus cytotoxicus TaxID=580165 RepID=UPI000B9679F7|nr:hypothetical protein [Bacillus cytotoxicus]AWC45818.1 hypothetical protein CG479_015760 [Bacillus cytotoxicus]AWC53918.1 hypothetical protein CG477_016770 [Bacillus cytotoxicus]AWC58045.1 hypothetical protein CG476_016795 [Bacillus cytotoxicus]AWC66179.1 hypothetical protein CG475_016800 [Bacillus cytotoxicus]MDH2866466.1 hypothetical protein [Bacillus cytotoxicus]